LTGDPRKSQEEAHEDQERVKEVGGPPLAFLRSPGPFGLPSGSSPAPRQSAIRPCVRAYLFDKREEKII